MTKRTYTFIILFAFGLLALASGISGAFNMPKLRLENVDVVVGEVIDCGTRTSTRFREGKGTSSTIFYFILKNSDQRFAIYRRDGTYFDMRQEIRIGDTIKVFYRHSSKEYNKQVFQVEEGDSIILYHRDYMHQESFITAMALLFGISLTIGSYLWYRKFNLVKFLLR